MEYSSRGIQVLVIVLNLLLQYSRISCNFLSFSLGRELSMFSTSLIKFARIRL